mmetsp:Transcript_16853/g.12045  ORF Transcript_16853/g.12045 Transcript_16853/m.12045 type:complete len:140 (-) Transcript_16853:347-766(-)|eukprot:CAMPEP_0202971318 /NCGR_PEP_ID=MMETSP1396-20130829/25999_1 /ASSEMBLY_ACC=CAM_ASM_000872 /TAXON_ID= /ORGANISM="Pseudokeronopsis sp., Strain Brazil" /LENGTH=139 /DNA_ID=CAMNT_0049700575 /DNA_START=103 /DNA_END=522 /DNA_ORIENTATION=+
MLQATHYHYTAYKTLVGSAMLIVLAVAFGFQAAASKDHCMSFMFGYLTLSIALIFFALGVSALIIKNTYSQVVDQQCQDEYGVIYELDMIYLKGDQMMCSAACPCAANLDHFPSDYLQYVSEDKGAETILDCPETNLTP